MNKIIEGANAALRAAKCEHAFVAAPKQPLDKRYFRQYCPRCDATFLSPRANPDQLLTVAGQGALK